MHWPLRLLQGQESAGQSTLVVKIVKIAPANTHFRSPDSTHSVSVHEPSTDCQVTFSAVYQPPNLLERPKVQRVSRHQAAISVGSSCMGHANHLKPQTSATEGCAQEGSLHPMLASSGLGNCSA